MNYSGTILDPHTRIHFEIGSKTGYAETVTIPKSLIDLDMFLQATDKNNKQEHRDQLRQNILETALKYIESLGFTNISEYQLDEQEFEKSFHAVLTLKGKESFMLGAPDTTAYDINIDYNNGLSRRVCTLKELREDLMVSALRQATTSHQIRSLMLLSEESDYDFFTGHVHLNDLREEKKYSVCSVEIDEENMDVRVVETLRDNVGWVEAVKLKDTFSKQQPDDKIAIREQFIQSLFKF